MIAVGSTNASKVYLGSEEISKIYLGSTQIWGGTEPSPEPDDPIPSSYTDWLISLGCICWLPLGSDGDLQDRISEVSLQTTGNGTFAWDSTAGMYKIITSNANSKYVAWLNNGMNASSFSDNCFTTLTTFMKDSTGYYANGQISPISTDSNTKLALSPLYNSTGNVSGYPSTVIKLANYTGSDERILIAEGSIYSQTSTVTGYLPNNWTVGSNGLAIGMIPTNSSIAQYTNKTYYIKDIYIFNKKLTLTQIRQIQGYDPLPSGVQL